MKEKGSKSNIVRFAKALAAFLAAFLFLVAGIVILVDPFFHYHEPIGPLKKVLVKPEYQVMGTIDRFGYDSVLFGSSTAENYSNADFEGCVIKAVHNGATTADLMYYADRVFARSQKEGRTIRNVYYSLDVYALLTEAHQAAFSYDGMPSYLYDKNPFNDVKYVFNRDVLFEDIPYMIYESLIDRYDENYGFAWFEGKEFSEEWALSHAKAERVAVADKKEKEEYMPLARANIERLTDMVNSHPETNFVFLLPPYSCFFWDNAERGGNTEGYIYAVGEAVRNLAACPNVTFYSFLDDEETTLNIAHYMDTMHVDPAYNHKMAMAIQGKEEYGRLLTAEDADAYVQRLTEFAEKANALAKSYYGE